MMSKRYSAFDTAIYYLSFKDNTKKELYNKLIEKGYSEEESEEAINKCLYYGYINDSHYALSYIKSNNRKKGYSIIKRELLLKGIEKETIEDIYSDMELNQDDVIDSIFIKRFNNCDFNDKKVTNRVISYFLRRGFEYDSIRKTMSKYKNIS